MSQTSENNSCPFIEHLNLRVYHISFRHAVSTLLTDTGRFATDPILPMQGTQSILIQSSPDCYEVTSAKKLADLGVNVSAGLITDDLCVDVGVVTAPAVPLTGTIS
jgi:hypothetical protein